MKYRAFFVKIKVGFMMSRVHIYLFSIQYKQSLKESYYVYSVLMLHTIYLCEVGCPCYTVREPKLEGNVCLTLAGSEKPRLLHSQEFVFQNDAFLPTLSGYLPQLRSQAGASLSVQRPVCLPGSVLCVL